MECFPLAAATLREAPTERRGPQWDWRSLEVRDDALTQRRSKYGSLINPFGGEGGSSRYVQCHGGAFAHFDDVQVRIVDEAANYRERLASPIA